MRWQQLPGQAELIEGLMAEVEADDDWRWLELSCSLAADRGDELSDVDVGVGYTMSAEAMRTKGLALVESMGATRGVLVHSEPSWPEGIVRFAVEYRSGVQLDLLVMPAEQRPGLPEQSIALVDKDDVLAEVWTPPVAAASDRDATEWLFLGCWAVSNVAKYVQRGSPFEAVEALHQARTEMLRLFAVGQGVPYPAFGLTSLLDFEPFDLPDRLAATYALPTDPAEIIEGARVVADLLEAAARRAAGRLELDLSTPWADIARARLDAADPGRPPEANR